MVLFFGVTPTKRNVGMANWANMDSPNVVRHSPRRMCFLLHCPKLRKKEPFFAIVSDTEPSPPFIHAFMVSSSLSLTSLPVSV